MNKLLNKINTDKLIDIAIILAFGIVTFLLARGIVLNFAKPKILNIVGQDFVYKTIESVNIENEIIIQDKEGEVKDTQTELISVNDLSDSITFANIGDKKILAVPQQQEGEAGVSNLTYKIINDTHYFFVHSNQGVNTSSFLGDYLYNNLDDKGERIRTITFQDSNGRQRDYKIIDSEVVHAGKEDENSLEITEDRKVLYTCVPGTDGNRKQVWLLDPQ